MVWLRYTKNCKSYPRDEDVENFKKTAVKKLMSNLEKKLKSTEAGSFTSLTEKEIINRWGISLHSIHIIGDVKIAFISLEITFRHSIISEICGYLEGENMKSKAAKKYATKADLMRMKKEDEKQDKEMMKDKMNNVKSKKK